jgi:O-antigen/teichoic acid export membrane protein
MSPLPSIKRNIAANYVAQFYVMGIGIVMAPVYLDYMGTEAYGLIGFFTMMSAWFQLLDLGLTPTLMREVARFRGGAISAGTLRSYLRALEGIFGGVSLAGGVALALFSAWIAAHWLKAKGLPADEIAHAVMLMGLAVPLRWMSGLHRGAVAGFERQVWLSGYNVAVATARFVGVLVIFATLGTTPTLFFGYQLTIAALELTGLVAITYRLVHSGGIAREKFSWKPFLGNLKFSLVIAFTAAVWVVITQTDKLVLSKLLPLAQFGMFSIAVLAASAINAASGPLSQALLPRLTKLATEKDEAGLRRLYGNATQLACVLVAPTVVVLYFFAEPILQAWTGKPALAHYAAPILRLYAIGNGCLVLSALAYYMQYARGDLKLHFIGNAAGLILLVPLFVVAAQHYGGIGTGAVWAGFSLAYALIWVPVIHARVFKGQHWRWMGRNVLPITIPTLLLGWLSATVTPIPGGRWSTFVVLAVISIVLLSLAAGCSSVARDWIRAKLMSLITNWPKVLP